MRRQSLCKQVGMVMAKVRASIWSDAPTALLFRAPTIRGLAREIKISKGSAAQTTDVAIPRAPFTDAQRAAGVEVLPIQADFFCSPIQQMGLSHRCFSDSHHGFFMQCRDYTP